MEVVDIKKILVPNLLIYIYLHCVRSSLWCATMLATLIFMERTTNFRQLKPKNNDPIFRWICRILHELLFIGVLHISTSNLINKQTLYFGSIDDEVMHHSDAKWLHIWIKFFINWEIDWFFFENVREGKFVVCLKVFCQASQ